MLALQVFSAVHCPSTLEPTICEDRCLHHWPQETSDPHNILPGGYVGDIIGTVTSDTMMQKETGQPKTGAEPPKATNMLFAIPKKGRLHDQIIKLLKGAGLACNAALPVIRMRRNKSP